MGTYPKPNDFNHATLHFNAKSKQIHLRPSMSAIFRLFSPFKPERWVHMGMNKTLYRCVCVFPSVFGVFCRTTSTPKMGMLLGGAHLNSRLRIGCNRVRPHRSSRPDPALQPWVPVFVYHYEHPGTPMKIPVPGYLSSAGVPVPGYLYEDRSMNTHTRLNHPSIEQKVSRVNRVACSDGDPLIGWTATTHPVRPGRR